MKIPTERERLRVAESVDRAGALISLIASSLTRNPQELSSVSDKATSADVQTHARDVIRAMEVQTRYLRQALKRAWVMLADLKGTIDQAEQDIYFVTPRSCSNAFNRWAWT